MYSINISVLHTVQGKQTNKILKFSQVVSVRNPKDDTLAEDDALIIEVNKVIFFLVYWQIGNFLPKDLMTPPLP